MLIEYEPDADILYLTLAKGGRGSLCLDDGNDVLTRIDPHTGSVLGFTILQFSDFAENPEALRLAYVKPRQEKEALLEAIRRFCSEAPRSGRLATHRRASVELNAEGMARFQRFRARAKRTCKKS